jgi:hypothetical protein
MSTQNFHTLLDEASILDDAPRNTQKIQVLSNILRQFVDKHLELLNKKLSNTMSIYTMKYSQLIELKS